MAQCQPGDRSAFLSGSMEFDLAEWFDNDERPTLVLDLNDKSIEEPRLHFCFANRAFREHASRSTSLKLVLQDPSAPAAPNGQMECPQNFKKWATDPSSPSHTHKRKSPSMASDGCVWTNKTIGKRWRVVSGSKIPGGHPDGEEASVIAAPVASFERLTTDTSKDTGAIHERMPSMFWTDALPWTEHASLFRKTDWSKTALGPLASGPRRTIVYNESYIPIASTKHPESFASTCEITWTEVYSEIDSAMREAENSGQAVTMENQFFLIERQGSLEDLASFWHDIVKTFESNSSDIPLAVIYSIEQQHGGNMMCKYQASVGIDKDHPTLIRYGDLHTSAHGLIPYFRKAIAARGPLLLIDGEEIMAGHIFEANHWRGFGVPSSRFIVLPLSAGEGVLGFMFWGLNPRRPHDEDSKQFVELLSRQLQSSLTSTVFLDQARLNQKKLETDLALAESRFKTMAELNPGGIFYISPRGEVLYGNNTCKYARHSHASQLTCFADYEMTGHKRNYKAVMSFMDVIHEDDRNLMEKEWHLLTVEHSQRNIELLLKKKVLLNGEWRHTRILASAVPEMDANGQLKSIMGTIIDVSEIKQAQEKAVELSGLQRQSRIEAEEAKAAQERHIDITRFERRLNPLNHEMRNPLSAILQSADSISTTITDYQTSKNQSISDLLDSTIESASIITLCAQQQNRILNDILTLSKLDSGLLPVAASLAQPEAIARDTLKMFEGELHSNGIEWNFVIEETYKQYKIDWVMIDPSRLSQVSPVFTSYDTRGCKKSVEKPGGYA
ncbi:MAG: hypothetical protein Q9200_004364 [Gallowayella weberi]